MIKLLIDYLFKPYSFEYDDRTKTWKFFNRAYRQIETIFCGFVFIMSFEIMNQRYESAFAVMILAAIIYCLNLQIIACNIIYRDNNQKFKDALEYKIKGE